MMSRFLFLGFLFFIVVNIIFPKSILYRIDDQYSVFILDISLFSQDETLEFWGTNKKNKMIRVASFKYPKLTIDQQKKLFLEFTNINVKKMEDIWSNLSATKKLANLGINSSSVQFLFSNRFRFAKEVTSFQIRSRKSKKVFDSGVAISINLKKINSKIKFDIQNEITGIRLKWTSKIYPELSHISINKIFGSDSKKYSIFRYSILNKDHKKPINFLDTSVSEGKEYTYLLQNILTGNIPLPILKKNIRYFVNSDIFLPPKIIELKQQEENLFISWEQKNLLQVRDISIFISIGNQNFQEKYTKILPFTKDYIIDLKDWNTYYRVYLLARSINGHVQKSMIRGVRVRKISLTEKVTLSPSFLKGAVVLNWKKMRIEPYHDFNSLVLFKGLSNNRLFFFKEVGIKDVKYQDTQVENGNIYFYQLRSRNSRGSFTDISTITEIPVIFDEPLEKPLFLFADVFDSIRNLKKIYKVRLNWKISNINKIQGLRLERINLTDESEKKKSILLDRNQIEYVDFEDIKVNNYYSFLLFAISTTGQESEPLSTEVKILYVSSPELKNITIIADKEKQLSASLLWKFPDGGKEVFVDIYCRDLERKSSFSKLNKKNVLARELNYFFSVPKAGRYEFYLQTHIDKVKKVYRSPILRFTF